MFSFFKRKNKPEVPEWASFFSPDEYSKFLKAIEKYFYQKNVTYTLGDGMINAGPNDFGFNILGLTNVAQVCKFDDNRSYNEVVSQHFETMLRVNEFDKDFNKIIDDYEQIKEYLAVRLYDEGYFSSVGKENVVGYTFVGNIYAALVFDLPDGIISIKPEQAEKWNKDFDELIATGIRNIRAKCPIDLSEEPFNDIKIWLAQGDHFFSGNILFDLEKYPQLVGSYGSLIGIPHRHGVIIYPINDIAAVTAINELIPLINGMHQEGPGSVSNQLLWYANGKIEDQPYKIDDDTIQFFPTDNFTSMLNSLAGDDE